MDTNHGPILSVRELRVSFALATGDYPALDGIDLDLHCGRTLALVGESGCGKSVLALSMLGLIAPPGRVTGSIRYRKIEIVDAGDEVLCNLRGNHISMVFQEPMTALNPVMRIGEQVAEPFLVHRGLRRSAARAEALRVLREVGVPAPEERYDSYAHELSGGLRQRVMIAMALACEPDVFIADEPTTALDVTIQRQILDSIAELQRRRQMATLFITHDLALVESLADEVAVMYAGHLVEHAAMEELVRRPRHPYTRALWRANPATGQPGHRLHAIPGAVPDITARPAGCPFHDRCERPDDRCREERPTLEDGVACFFPYDEPLAEPA